ncbi:MAG: CBS domain-containing protein [Pirellulales bacterium]|nr:CBS domain-containing protein [Pirellulales bacterium]
MHRSHSRYCSRRGGATVEYALFLTLIAASVFAAGQCVNLSVHRTMRQVASASGSATASSAKAAAPTLDATVPALASLEQAERRIAQGQLGVMACGLFLGGLIWYRLYCRRRPAAKTADGAEHPFVDEKQSLLFDKRQEVLRILAGDWQVLMDGRLLVGHLMSRRVMTVPPVTPAEEVRRTMQQNRLRHLMVRDRDGRLLGVISDRDLARPKAKDAEQLMTPNPIHVTPDTPIAPAITLLLNKHISSLPVIEGGMLVGVLTTTDLIMALQCTLQTLSRIARQLTDQPSLDESDPPPTTQAVDGELVGSGA